MMEKSTPQNKNPEKATSKFEIRTMEKDLRRLLAARLGKTPEEIIIEQLQSGERGQSRTKVDLFIKKYLKIVLSILLVLTFLAIVISVLWLQPEKPAQTPTAYHSICENEQCKLVGGEGQDKCRQDEDCKTAGLAPSPPSPLLPAYVQETLVLKNVSSDQFYSALAENLKKTYQEGSIRALFLATGENSSPQKYLEFSEAIEALNISIPATIRSYVDEYTLFLYTAGQKEEDRCRLDEISETRCWGPRIVLVLKLNERNEEIITKLRQWEPTMLQNLRSIILAPSTESLPEFQDFIYKEQPIRYKNLEISTVTVNYAIINNLLIIGTSKEAVFAAIDTVL